MSQYIADLKKWLQARGQVLSSVTTQQSLAVFTSMVLIFRVTSFLM